MANKPVSSPYPAALWTAFLKFLFYDFSDYRTGPISTGTLETTVVVPFSKQRATGKSKRAIFRDARVERNRTSL